MGAQMIIAVVSLAFVAVVLLSVLVNPKGKPLDWMWPPTKPFERIWAYFTAPLPRADGRNPVLRVA